MESESLELRIERINSLGNLQMKLIKCFFHGHSLTKTYVAGKAVIHVHGRILRPIRVSFCLTLTSGDEHVLLSGNDEMHVFVWIGNIPKNACPVASIARLQFLDYCDMGITDATEIGVSATSETLFSIFDRKLSALYDLLGVKVGQLIDEVIQGSTQIVNRLSDQDADFRRDNLRRALLVGCEGGDIELPRLILTDSGVTVRVSRELIKQGLQIKQVFFAPTDPLVSAIQTVHMLYYPQGDDYGKKDSKDTQRALQDSHPHKGRVRVQSKEGCKAQINSRQPEEVESQTLPSRRFGDCISKHTHSGRIEDA